MPNASSNSAKKPPGLIATEKAVTNAVPEIIAGMKKIILKNL
jgi:hypothetical protein